jgi:hypothetical protein
MNPAQKPQGGICEEGANSLKGKSAGIVSEEASGRQPHGNTDPHVL